MRAPEFWHQPPGLAVKLLWPFERAWEAGAHLRHAFARPYRADIPIICVGNLVAGGSGKTPVVLSLARLLSEAGRQVHIVTRGYGGRLAGPVRVDPQTHDAVAVGDEALLLAQRAPCWVAHDRAAGITAAAGAGADLVLLDDGFQNPHVVKDCALLVVDTAYGFGNRHMIPAGPLREPVAEGLARADAVVLLGNGPQPPALREFGKPVFAARLMPVAALPLKARPAVAFAGIGRPEKFFATLREAGVAVIAEHAFPDHHPYRPAEIAALLGDAERTGAALITTAKDWVRLPTALREGIEVLDVEICWRDQPAIAQFVRDVARHRPDPFDRNRPAG